MSAPRKKRPTGVVGLVPAPTALLAGCTATADPANPPPSNAPYEAPQNPDGNPAVDDPDEEIPSADGIPQELGQAKIEPITASDIVLLDEGGLEYSMQVIDPATGTAKTKIVTGPGIGGPSIQPLQGETAGVPAMPASQW